MDVRKLAYEYGVQLAKAEFEKKADFGVPPGSTFPDDTDEAVRHLADRGSRFGAGSTGLLGALGGAGAGYTLGGKHRLLAALLAGTGGGALGYGLGRRDDLRDQRDAQYEMRRRARFAAGG